MHILLKYIIALQLSYAAGLRNPQSKGLVCKFAVQRNIKVYMA